MPCCSCRLARQGQLRYNYAMVQPRRSSHTLWLVLALVAALVAATVLWLRGMQAGGGPSPLSTPSALDSSPLSTPLPPAPDVSAETTPSPPPSWTGGGAVLLWVVLGIVLALGIAFVILRWYRRAA